MPSSIDSDLASRLDELPELLPFPEVALRLMEACNNPKTGVRELCQIIECDTSLSLKLLQISNSSMYGNAGQIKTIGHAAVLLGVKGLRDLALSAAANEVFEKSQKKNPAAEQLWNHSLGCAAVAKILAEKLPNVSPDEAFLAGLVHDVGKLILMEVFPTHYDLIPKALSGVSTVEEEHEEYGLSHMELGERCGDDWGLPPEISDAIRYHHIPSEAEIAEELTEVVCAANQLSKIWILGADEVDSFCVRDVLEQTNLSFDDPTIEEMRDRALQNYSGKVPGA